MNGEIKMPEFPATYFLDLKTSISKNLKFKLLQYEMGEETPSFEQMKANFLY